MAASAQDAYNEGWDAYECGEPEWCPYDGGKKWSEWIRGWNDAWLCANPK